MVTFSGPFPELVTDVAVDQAVDIGTLLVIRMDIVHTTNYETQHGSIGRRSDRRQDRAHSCKTI